MKKITNAKFKKEPFLISFVLKTRISQHTKLLLASNYDTTTDLIKDMKHNLLKHIEAVCHGASVRAIAVSTRVLNH